MASVRCGIGWHRPRDGGRWNHGYCFTTCARCGRDMVRSVFGEWHVPKGFRVVPGTTQTIARLDAELAMRDAAKTAAASPPPAEPPAPAPRAAPPRPAAARSRGAGSPFDFDDFDAIDPNAGAFPVRSAQPDPSQPPLSRAAK